VSLYNEVKTRFAADPERWAADLGLQQARKSPWTGKWVNNIICPVCSDTNGSATLLVDSNAKSPGWLNCKQCQFKGELFDWYSQLAGIKEPGKNKINVCKAIAERMGINLEEFSSTRRNKAPLDKIPLRLTPDILKKAGDRLCDGEMGARARDFLRGRKISPDLAAQAGVGSYAEGRILFALHDEQSGALRGRFKTYDPATKIPGWSNHQSSGETRSANGFFPRNDVPESDSDAIILLLEGEWDCLTATYATSQLPDSMFHLGRCYFG
jgi:hypothetical protein